jgi:cytosine/adenosine deaminase-related metal-dependent hydrolase
MKTRHASAILLSALLLALIPPVGVAAQRREVPHAPPRGNEGDGPFQRLIIRGATLVDGTGAPPVGPVDIVVEGSRIVEVRSVGAPGVPIHPERRPQGATKELDAHGMYVLPGFVDVHAHTGGVAQGTPAEYVYKLWMAHGVTTIRDPGAGNGVDWELEARERSAKNEIVAPHIYVYAFVGTGWDGGPVTTPEKAREYVRWAAAKGVDGMKLIPGTYPVSNDPAVIAAVIDEANKLHLGSMAHLSQQAVARVNALDAARMGLGSMEHYYGLPEALFDDRTIQDFPATYNYNNEYDRFGQAGRLWKQAARPGSPKWNAVMDEMLKLHFTIDPTMTIYEASRDAMRARRAEWHDIYTLPSLWQFYQPSRESHGSYWYHWTTQDEIEWKHDFKLWMAFLNEYKNRGGWVTTGSDAGFIYSLYGFGYIRELELLQEAGFSPLEVVRSATMYGAQLLAQQQGKQADFGTVEPGKRADLVITEHNPLEDFKVLYGTGTLRLNDQTGKVERVGGVRWTIKDGIVYDARQLLDDVATMVRDAKVKAGMAPDAPLTVVRELPGR